MDDSQADTPFYAVRARFSPQSGDDSYLPRLATVRNVRSITRRTGRSRLMDKMTRFCSREYHPSILGVTSVLLYLSFRCVDLNLLCLRHRTSASRILLESFDWVLCTPH